MVILIVLKKTTTVRKDFECYEEVCLILVFILKIKLSKKMWNTYIYIYISVTGIAFVINTND